MNLLVAGTLVVTGVRTQNHENGGCADVAAIWQGSKIKREDLHPGCTHPLLPLVLPFSALPGLIDARFTLR